MPWLAAAVPVVAGVAGAIGSGISSADDDVGDDAYERKREINKGAFDNPYGAASRGEVDMHLNSVGGRTAPAMGAAQQGQVATYGGAYLAPWQKSNEVSIGAASTTRAVEGQSARINRDDAQFRAGQQGLAKDLTEAAAGRGPSLASMQLQGATDRNIKGQLAVAATQRGNPALAQRNAAFAAAVANRQAGIDSAQLRVSEQLAARQQLAGVLGQGREQDIGVNTAQGGFDQGMNVANLQASNQTNLANLDATNRFLMQQGSMNLQNNQFNAASLNSRNLSQAQMEQEAELSNMRARNEMYGRNAELQQGANIQNLQSQLQTMGMNDAQIRYLLSQKYSMDEQNRQAQIDYERMATGQDSAFRDMLYNDSEAKANRFKGYFDNAVSSVAKGASAAGGASGAGTGAK